MPFLCKIVEFRRGSCRIEFTFALDTGMKRRKVAVALDILERMNFVPQIRHYFLYQRPLSSLQKTDGVALGSIVAKKPISKNHYGHVTGVRWLVERGCLKEEEAARTHEELISLLINSRAMQEFSASNEWFVPMINGILNARVRPSLGIETSRAELKDDEGKKIGVFLLASLMVNITAPAGVHEWIGKYPSLVEIANEESWFESFIVEISKAILMENAWGVKGRVLMGAGVCVLEGFTDVTSLYVYYHSHPEWFWLFQVNLSLCMASLLFQLFIAAVQYHKKGVFMILREWVFILTFTKPLVDAYRVVTKAASQTVDADPELTFDLLTMYVITRVLESCVETVPGAIIQLSAVMQGLPVDSANVNSLAISFALSAFAAGFVGASISYDLDTSPEDRKCMKEQFGIFPTGGLERGVAFSLSVIVSTINCIMSEFLFALMITLSPRLFALFVVADLFVYLVMYKTWFMGEFKFGLVDFRLGTVMNFILDLSFNVFIKAFNTFCAPVSFKSPAFMGGLFWTVQFALVQITTLVLVWTWVFRFEEARDVLGVPPLSPNAVTEATQGNPMVLNLAIALCACECLCFAVFLYLVPPEHQSGFSGFLSTKGCRDCTERMWQEGNDEIKLYICLGWRMEYYYHFIDEYGAWFEEMFEIWEDEKPHFYHEDLFLRIPHEVLKFHRDDDDAGMMTTMAGGGFGLGRVSSGKSSGGLSGAAGGSGSSAHNNIVEKYGAILKARQAEVDASAQQQGKQQARQLAGYDVMEIASDDRPASDEANGSLTAGRREKRATGWRNDDDLEAASSGRASSAAASSERNDSESSTRSVRVTGPAESAAPPLPINPDSPTSQDGKAKRDSMLMKRRASSRERKDSEADEPITPTVKIRRYRSTFMDRITYGDTKGEAKLKNAAEETLRNLFDQMHVSDNVAGKIVDRKRKDGKDFVAVSIKPTVSIIGRSGSGFKNAQGGLTGVVQRNTTVKMKTGIAQSPTLHFEAFCDDELLYIKGDGTSSVGSEASSNFDNDNDKSGGEIVERSGFNNEGDAALDAEMALNFNDVGESTIIIDDELEKALMDGSRRNMLEIIRSNVAKQIGLHSKKSGIKGGHVRESFLAKWS
jgi:hypothetical protein